MHLEGTPEAVARCRSVVAVGFNCIEPRLLCKLLAEATTVTDMPLVCYPNSGEAYDSKLGWRQDLCGPEVGDDVGVELRGVAQLEVGAGRKGHRVARSEDVAAAEAAARGGGRGRERGGRERGGERRGQQQRRRDTLARRGVGAGCGTSACA